MFVPYSTHPNKDVREKNRNKVRWHVLLRLSSFVTVFFMLFLGLELTDSSFDKRRIALDQLLHGSEKRARGGGNNHAEDATL